MEQREIKALAAQLCNALGNGWSIDGKWDADGMPNARINHTDGRQLWIGRSRKPGFVVIHGGYPDYDADIRHPDNHEITVKAERGARAIARDIERRIMPAYVEDLARLRELDEQHRAAYLARESYAERVYRALGIKPRPAASIADHERRRQRKATQTEVTLYDVPGVYGTVRIDFRAETVHLDVANVPADKALEMLRILVR